MSYVEIRFIRKHHFHKKHYLGKPIRKAPLAIIKKILTFAPWVSLGRPAPLEPPQGRKTARIEGRSGAMQGAYPHFL